MWNSYEAKLSGRNEPPLSPPTLTEGVVCTHTPMTTGQTCRSLWYACILNKYGKIWLARWPRGYKHLVPNLMTWLPSLESMLWARGLIGTDTPGCPLTPTGVPWHRHSLPLLICVNSIFAKRFLMFDQWKYTEVCVNYCVCFNFWKPCICFQKTIYLQVTEEQFTWAQTKHWNWINFIIIYIV